MTTEIPDSPWRNGLMSDRFGRNGYVAILPGVELVAPVLSQPEFLIECGRAGVASAPISEMETSVHFWRNGI